MVKKLKKG